jgi:hypothetical protein
VVAVAVVLELLHLNQLQQEVEAMVVQVLLFCATLPLLQSQLALGLQAQLQLWEQIRSQQ